MTCDIEPKEELEEAEQMIMTTDMGNNRPTTVVQTVVQVDVQPSITTTMPCFLSCYGHTGE